MPRLEEPKEIKTAEQATQPRYVEVPIDLQLINQKINFIIDKLERIYPEAK
jgi:hypothetical protein